MVAAAPVRIVIRRRRLIPAFSSTSAENKPSSDKLKPVPKLNPSSRRYTSRVRPALKWLM